MNNTLRKTGWAVVIASLLFTSCEKSQDSVAGPGATPKRIDFSQLASNPRFVNMVRQMESSSAARNPNGQAGFIAPFFTSDGFGMAENIVIDTSNGGFAFVEGQFAFFQAEYDGNDFFRVNNDGTVSVHLNSDNAFLSHYDIASNVELTTNKGHLSMNYAGPAGSFDIFDPDGNFLFTIYFIDIFNNPRAVSFQGSGMVSAGGNSRKQRLVGTWVANPGWTHINIGFKLN